MSSLFQGLFEHIDKYRSTPLPSNVSPDTLILGQVLKVLTGEELEEGANKGDFDSLADPMEPLKYAGLILFKADKLDGYKYENEVSRIALPIDRSNYRLPIPGEIVLLVAAVSDNALSSDKVYYYTNIITGKDPIRNTSSPYKLTGASRVTKPPAIQLPGALAAAQDEFSSRFEKRFAHNTHTMTKEGKVVPLMREGDKIVEGRFGGSIKFTSTIAKVAPQAWPNSPLGKNVVDNSNDGDPFIIIKNTKPILAENDPTDKVTLVDDDINADMSSIYVNTSQPIPLIVGSSKKMYTWNIEIESKPDSIFASIDKETVRLQEFFPDTYDPNQVVTGTAQISILNTGGELSGLVPGGVGTGGPLGTNGNLGDDVMKPIGQGRHKLAIEAADAFIRMADAARAVGVNPVVTDSYRPFSVQDAIFDWDLYVATGGDRTHTAANFTRSAKRKKKGTNGTVAVAFPGTSNHGWGKAIDISGAAWKKFVRNRGVEFGWSWYEGRQVNEDWHFTYDPTKKDIWPA